MQEEGKLPQPAMIVVDSLLLSMLQVTKMYVAAVAVVLLLYVVWQKRVDYRLGAGTLGGDVDDESETDGTETEET